MQKKVRIITMTSEAQRCPEVCECPDGRKSEEIVLQSKHLPTAIRRMVSALTTLCSAPGCLENPHGFFALRNEDSKWHIPYEDMPDWAVGTPSLPLAVVSS